jgi:hypothetical protein
MGVPPNLRVSETGSDTTASTRGLSHVHGGVPWDPTGERSPE